ncbi:TetR/AcrR family transcriptional regulator [Longimicrobium sp.]|uniref:TetR/AcrR family transcriptional regulator n=1 Tax=Longimicrobium sp. TaxID=2029185 RepID=UPI003B3A2554
MMNRPPRSVRKKGEDRRVVRTRQALGSALVELMLARRFDDISVQQVLDRARVGRATFYAHFRNKNDLLLSDTERFWGVLERSFLASVGDSRRVAPVAELFAHVADYHRFTRALEQSALREPVYDLLTGLLARLIERRMAELSPAAGTPSLPPAATARMFGAALIEMMRWWLNRGAQPGAREMDAQFHEIVWGGLARMAPQPIEST